MTILIIGDSWGCGTWGPLETGYGLMSTGLQHLLEKDGHQIDNQACGGESNHAQLTRLKFRLDHKELDSTKYDLIIMFHTEGSRDLFDGAPIMMPPDSDDFSTWSSQACVASWEYSKNFITEIYKQYHIPFMVLGACAPVPEFDSIEAIQYCFHDVLGTHGVPRNNNFAWTKQAIFNWVNKFSDQYPLVSTHLIDTFDEFHSAYRDHHLFEPDLWHYNDKGCSLIYDWVKEKL